MIVKMTLCASVLILLAPQSGGLAEDAKAQPSVEKTVEQPAEKAPAPVEAQTETPADQKSADQPAAAEAEPEEKEVDGVKLAAIEAQYRFLHEPGTAALWIGAARGGQGVDVVGPPTRRLDDA